MKTKSEDSINSKEIILDSGSFIDDNFNNVSVYT